MKRQLFFLSISTLFCVCTSLGSIHVLDEEQVVASVELSLHSAVLADNPDLIKKMLAEGYYIDEQDAFGSTALMLAIKKGFLACVSLLLSRGASLKVKNRKGHDVFYYALKKRSDKSVKLKLINALMVNAEVQDSTCMIAELVKDYFIEKEQVSFLSHLFFDALEANCLTIMEHLISRKFIINTDYYFTHDVLRTNLFAHPIVFAGLCGQPKVYNFLLAKGADSFACDTQFKRTAFHWAAFMGKDIFFEDIIKAHKEKNNSSGRTIGKHVIVDNYMTEESTFIKLFNVTDSDGSTPGFLAVEALQVNIVELLLKYDYFGDVNAQNNKGYGPLHLAAKKGNGAICALLLQKRADIEAQVHGKYGLTALALAAANGHKNVVELLIDYKACIEGVEERDANFERGILSPRRNNQKVRLPTPLELAAIGGHAEVVKLLASRGAVVRVPAKTKETTLLHMMAKKVTYEHQINDLGYNEVIAFLLSQGMTVDALDEQGKTALAYAVQDGRKSVEEALRAHGAK